jgi:hypothetical protein
MPLKAQIGLKTRVSRYFKIGEFWAQIYNVFLLKVYSHSKHAVFSWIGCIFLGMKTDV